MSALKVLEGDFSGWTCAACGQALALRPVDLEYMGSRFNVELPRSEEHTSELQSH